MASKVVEISWWSFSASMYRMINKIESAVTLVRVSSLSQPLCSGMLCIHVGRDCIFVESKESPSYLPRSTCYA